MLSAIENCHRNINIPFRFCKSNNAVNPSVKFSASCWSADRIWSQWGPTYDIQQFWNIYAFYQNKYTPFRIISHLVLVRNYTTEWWEGVFFGIQIHFYVFGGSTRRKHLGFRRKVPFQIFTSQMYFSSSLELDLLSLRSVVCTSVPFLFVSCASQYFPPLVILRSRNRPEVDLLLNCNHGICDSTRSQIVKRPFWKMFRVRLLDLRSLDVADKWNTDWSKREINISLFFSTGGLLRFWKAWSWIYTDEHVITHKHRF